MREQPLPTAFAAAAFLAGFGLAAFAPQLFNDGDTWWHLAAGNWILAHHQVPTHDMFSYTFFGMAWDAHEWLSEIIMAISFRLDGWNGLHLLFGAAFGVTAGVVAGTLRRRMDLLPAVITTILGLTCVAGSLLARPHLLALPLLTIWTAALLNAREREGAPSFWLLPVMTVWANLHGTFAFGLALAAALGLEAAIASGWRRAVLVSWGVFLAASLIAALLTPQGLNGLLFPLRLLAMPGLASVGEWKPTDLSHLSPFLVALLAAFFFLALGRMRIAPLRAALIAALVFLGLSHVRHQMLFGTVAPLLAASAVGAAWPPRAADDLKRSWPVFAAALVAMLAARLVWPAMRGEDRVSPMAALAHVPGDLRTRPVLNAYDYGGYLIFRGVKVFIDGRTDMYPADFLKNNDRLDLGDQAAIRATLARYKIAWTILPAHSRAAQAMDRLEGWRRFYGDANAVVHVRD
jgi:hypothetical protein